MAEIGNHAGPHLVTLLDGLIPQRDHHRVYFPVSGTPPTRSPGTPPSIPKPNSCPTCRFQSSGRTSEQNDRARSHFGSRQRRSGAGRMDPSDEQRFGAVHVPDACHRRLVEQERPDGATAGREAFDETPHDRCPDITDQARAALPPHRDRGADRARTSSARTGPRCELQLLAAGERRRVVPAAAWTAAESVRTVRGGHGRRHHRSTTETNASPRLRRAAASYRRASRLRPRTVPAAKTRAAPCRHNQRPGRAPGDGSCGLQALRSAAAIIRANASSAGVNTAHPTASARYAPAGFGIANAPIRSPPA